MNQLIRKVDALDLNFFIPGVFDAEEVVGWVFEGLQETTDSQSVLSLGVFARSVLTIYWFGVIGRYLGAGITSLCHSEHQEYVLDMLMDKHGLDYWEITTDELYDEAMLMRHIDQDDYELYVADVAKILEAYHIFYVNSESPWYGLTYFDSFELSYPKIKISAHPFSNEVRPFLFRNMPIVKVW